MIHVCFTVYDEAGTFSKFAGTSMLSVFENISKPLPSVTVHILHDNTLTDDNRNKFSYLVGRCGQRVKFYNVEKLFEDSLEEIINLFAKVDKTYFNKATFYKFFIPRALPSNVEKAIYLEPNVIVNTDIGELWRVPLDDKILAAVPAISIDPDLQAQDKIIADGFVKKEDYFSSVVMLMNLKLLRGTEGKLTAGMKFVSEHNYTNLLAQTVLNYCFSLQTVKLPAQFNRQVRLARKKKESPAENIYHYAAYALQLNMNDAFNRLWMEYFAKTPWFDVETIGNLYESFRQVHNRQKKSMINLTAILANKSRAFCTVPAYVEEVKKLFHVRDDEEIIPLENQASLKKLIDSIGASRGKKVFFVMAQNFPFSVLTKAGFVYGRDFVNALEFLSEEQGVSMNSYPMIQAM